MSFLVPSRLRATAGGGRRQPWTAGGQGAPGASVTGPPEVKVTPRQRGSCESGETTSSKFLPQIFEM